MFTFSVLEYVVVTERTYYLKSGRRQGSAYERRVLRGALSLIIIPAVNFNFQNSLN
jgi:hypothetical protein